MSIIIIDGSPRYVLLTRVLHLGNRLTYVLHAQDTVPVLRGAEETIALFCTAKYTLVLSLRLLHPLSVFCFFTRKTKRF